MSRERNRFLILSRSLILAACFGCGLLFITSATQASSSHYPQKPWIDPAPPRGGDVPVEPDGPFPGTPEPVHPDVPPSPGTVVVYRCQEDHQELYELIRELRREIQELRDKLSAHQSSQTSSQDPCSKYLKRLSNAVYNIRYDLQIRVRFTGQKAPFETLLEKGYIPSIPEFWGRVRTSNKGQLSCLAE